MTKEYYGIIARTYITELDCGTIYPELHLKMIFREHITALDYKINYKNILQNHMYLKEFVLTTVIMAPGACRKNPFPGNPGNLELNSRSIIWTYKIMVVPHWVEKLSSKFM